MRRLSTSDTLYFNIFTIKIWPDENGKLTDRKKYFAGIFVGASGWSTAGIVATGE